MSHPFIEFTDGKRPAFPLTAPEVVIGRAAGCTLRLPLPGVADHHARLFTDEAGITWIEDLGGGGGTELNGQRVEAWEQVNEGDRIALGSATLVFRATAPVAAPQVAETAHTMIEQEAPAAVKALVARQKAALAAKSRSAMVPPASASRPSNAVAEEAPEPSSDANFRTVQMEAVDFPDLIPAVAPAAAPVAVTATASAPVRPRAGTVMGMGDAVSPYRPPTAPPPSAAPQYQPPASFAVAPPTADAALQQEEPPAPPWTEPPQETVQSYAHPSPGGQQWGASPLPPPSLQPAPMQQFTPPSGTDLPSPQPHGWGGAAPSLPHWANEPYTPPAKKGPLGSFSRAFDFYGQMFALAMRRKILLTPLVYDLAATAALSIALCLLTFVLPAALQSIVLYLGVILLYFIDYLCNSLTASLIYDQLTTGEASVKEAIPRVTRAVPGILTFAAVSGLLDGMTTWARERHDPLARILLDIVRKIWSTATYVVMPAMVLEGVSFGAAFKRSKELMAQDPTGVGAGIVALSLTSYLVGIVAFGLAWFFAGLFGRIHPALGLFAFLLFVNAFWSVSGWLKIAYSTLFYLWAAECEKSGTQEHALAPTPLRHALEAA